MTKNLPNGFTVLEMVVVIGIFTILFAFATVNIFNIKPESAFNTSISLIISDIKSQSMRSMAGDTAGTGTQDNYGIYFESNRYILFKGSTYTANDSSNFIINIDNSIRLSNINLPSNQIVFSKISGEIIGFQQGSAITIKNTFNDQSKTLTFNVYGVAVTEN